MLASGQKLCTMSVWNDSTATIPCWLSATWTQTNEQTKVFIAALESHASMTPFIMTLQWLNHGTQSLWGPPVLKQGAENIKGPRLKPVQKVF